MSYSETNTYATVEQVRLRLTTHGSLHATNKDVLDGQQDAQELAYLEQAIEWANGLIDESLLPWVDIEPRPQGVGWLSDRCVDIACYRVQTLGGTEADKPFLDDYTAAIDKLEDVRFGDLKVPGLDYTQTLRNGRQGHKPFQACNVRC